MPTKNGPFRASHKRPSSRCDADKRDEIASPHRLAPQAEVLTLPCCGPHCASRQILGTQPRDVRFVPKADIARCGKSAVIRLPRRRASSEVGTLMPSAFAVLRL